jgi:pimeloyl-ACP methyl ester carboxylesterase
MPSRWIEMNSSHKARNERPVSAVGNERLRVVTSRGAGTVPFYRSINERDAANISRIVILLHGRLRDADAYLLSAQRALAAASTDPAHTLLLVPQFLATADIAEHGLSADTLHWEWTSWMGGEDALGPAPLSSFDVLDAFIGQFADLARYPGLRDVVIAGHSGGAQVAHRYAIVGAGCNVAGVRCRYVIANPSSYVYFDSMRPYTDGVLRPADITACPGVDDWKYGVQRAPRYAASASFDALETRYAASDVIYLLGQQDCDPHHDALDRSCAAAAQGSHRLARGRSYFSYLEGRHAGLGHRCLEVAGVGHNGAAMLGSHEGVRALFDAQRLGSVVNSSTAGATD